MADDQSGLVIPKWLVIAALGLYVPFAPAISNEINSLRGAGRTEAAVETGLGEIVANKHRDFTERQKFSLAKANECDLEALFDLSQSIPGPINPEPLPEPRPRDSVVLDGW